MKEVTYEDWMKNKMPRMMWVWDSNEKEKKQRLVLHVFDTVPHNGYTLDHPVLALNEMNTDTIYYIHCAEIEKPRRFTNKELSRWLRMRSTREYTYTNGCNIYSNYIYSSDEADKEVENNILIRENDGEWKEPLIYIDE